MAKIEIGIRVDTEKGVAFFGFEEVNRRIAGGARVIELQPGSAIMHKIGEDEGEEVRLTLAGCQLVILLEDA